MLPQPAPLQHEELLFSGLTRLAQLNTLAETRGALARLAGGRNYSVSADLPCHLAAIVRLVGQSLSVVDADVLIERHTLFPYYRYFLPQERWPRIRAIALSHDAGRLKGALGILAHGVRATPVLRYCPICLRTTRAKLGIAGWIRGHHLPGVSACAQHSCSLIPTMSQSQLGHRARLWLPPQSSRNESTRASRTQNVFARISLDVLHYEGATMEPHRAAEVYEEEMRRRGWTRGSGRLDIAPLEQALRFELGRAMDWQIARRFGLAVDGAMPWLRDLLRPRARSCAPLAHVMLIQILFGNFDSFLQAYGEQPMQPPGPNLAPTDAPSRFDLAAAAVNDAALSCREVAATHGVSVTWVVQQRRRARIPISERRKNLDDTKIAAAKRLLGDGLSIAAVAQRCKLSVSSVYRILSTNPALVAGRDSQSFQRNRDARRSRWSRLVKSHPSLGTTALRRLASACYAWLYRCDRQWLLEHCPQRRPRQPTRRIDWEKRDAELAEQVIAAAPAFAATSKRARSPAGAVSLVYPLSSMVRHASNLPKLSEAAQSVATGRSRI